MFANEVTRSLKPYPMEQLAKIRSQLRSQGTTVYDFGTGDPKIPTYPKIVEALKAAIPAISQYPSVKGTKELRDAQLSYLERRFSVHLTKGMEIIPTSGSKEAIFHAALSAIDPSSEKKYMIYPDPGYPVYRSSALFAGGIPYPVAVNRDDGFLLKPWNLPKNVQQNAAVVWLNYPHNPTGATASTEYWVKAVEWAQKHDCLLFSDDCYIDIYDARYDKELKETGIDKRPTTPLTLSTDHVLSFMSLSKRSGLTGYRSGFIAGDARFLLPHLEARSNFGVGTPNFIQAAATVAWLDDVHVAERREIFTQRIKVAVPYLQEFKMLDAVPDATFYLWCRIPEKFGTDDVGFVLKLAEKGIVCSPSSWLGENVKGYVRFALVPDETDIKKAFEILRDFVS